MHIKTFAFNPFQVNTYLLYAEDGQGVVIDPAMSNPLEETAFNEYINHHGIRLIAAVNTHGHVDHVVGNAFVREAYGIPLYTHKSTWKFLEFAPEQGAMYGFRIAAQDKPDFFLEEGELFTCGSLVFKILYTPGHAEGSICLYHEASANVFCGDVLFNGSIGRTDLPTGDFDRLIRAIKEQLLVLPPETQVFPGHGPTTTIGFEQQTNPFLQ